MSDSPLSTAQKRAVASSARALTVVAPAGAGKTEVAARRIERILEDSPREEFRVLSLVYPSSACQELRERLAGCLGGDHRRVDIDTFHGFAWAVLRLHGTWIGLPLKLKVLDSDEDRHELLVTASRREQTAPPVDPSGTLYQLDIDRAQRKEESPEVARWRRILAESGSLDDQAMIEHAAELMENRSIRRIYAARYRHVIVDEAQNLTRAQYRLLTSLIGVPGQITSLQRS